MALFSHLGFQFSSQCSQATKMGGAVSYYSTEYLPTAFSDDKMIPPILEFLFLSYINMGSAPIFLNR